MMYDKTSKRCSICEDLWHYLHSVNAREPDCEMCPYVEEDCDIEDLEKEEMMYEK